MCVCWFVCCEMHSGHLHWIGNYAKLRTKEEGRCRESMDNPDFDFSFFSG